MGCSSSKPATTNAAAAPAAEQQPAKTLLPSDETPKPVGSDTQTSGSAPPQTATSAPSTNNAAVQDANAAASPRPTNGAVSYGNDAGSYGMMKHKVLNSSKHELEIMVSQFISHDSTVGKALGRQNEEKEWKVVYDRDKPPLALKLKVQEHKLHYHEVALEFNSNQMLGAAGGGMMKMREDFGYQWPFRGTIRGINEVNYFEVRPSKMYPDEWVPARITAQREDGLFEVLAQQYDALAPRGFVETQLPAVHKEDLREANSKKSLAVPESALTLKILKNDPIHANLSVANDTVTHSFGRPTPRVRAGEQTPRVSFTVNKDRTEVKANVGHEALSQFVSKEFRSLANASDRLSHTWTVQAGPFAKHVIKVSKNHTVGKIITLTIDDEILVECTKDCMKNSGSAWQCDFKFFGEKIMDFTVFTTNSDGAPTEDTAHVESKESYVHNCAVVVSNEGDFTSAQLWVDGSEFKELPMRPEYEEQPIVMEPRVLTATYGIAVPYKVDPNAPSTFVSMANNLLALPQGTELNARSLFGLCCSPNSIPPAGATEIRA